MIETKSKNNRGYTLVEMVIYLGILSLISVVIITTLFSFVSTYRNLTALRLAENSGIYSMERISRDLLSATSIDSTNSTLGTSPGVLTIVTSDSTNSTTTKYYVDSGVLKVDINGTYLGPLTGSGVSVTNLVFQSSNSGISKAVKIDLTLQGVSASTTKTKTYHNTVILRGSN